MKAKKIVSLLLCLVIICGSFVGNAMTANAVTSGTTGDCTWTLDGTVLTISGNGAMESMGYRGEKPSPWGRSITEVIIEEGVTCIGTFAFDTCSYLKSVIIPASVTEIWSGAFSGCYALTDVYISDIAAWCDIDCTDANPLQYAENLYINNELINELVIPEGVTSVSKYAFYKFTGLKSVTIPDSVISIGSYAFNGCTGMENIVLSKNVTKIGSYAFNGCTNLANVYYGGDKADRGVITIGDHNTPLTDAIWTYNYCEHIYSGSVVTEPTCTEQGYTTFTCEKCGHTYNDEFVAALGHNFGEWRVIVPADCEYPGSHTRICNTCGHVENGVIPALGHNYVANVIAPTCELGGYTEYICSNCNDSYVEDYVDAIGHNYFSMVVEPTCVEGGYTEYMCLNCQDVYKDAVVEALGHCFGEWIVDKTSSCTESGNRHRECSDCGFVEYEDIATVEHNYSNEWTTDAYANCSNSGSMSRHCVDCDAKTDIIIIAAYGHAFDSWRYERVPTCTVEGKIVCSCLLCGEQKNITIEPYGHDFSSEWTVDADPNCEKVGVKSRHCTRCDEVCDETEIAVLGHSYTDVVVEPTCIEQGYTEHICAVCGDYYKTDFVQAKGHSFTHYDKKDATCTESGHNDYDECSACLYTTYKEIAAFGHNYQAGGNGAYACTHCGNTISGGETHTYTKTIIKATAEHNGYTQYTCTDCGYFYRTDETVYNSSAAKFSISDCVVGAGKKVILNVAISNNPGIYSFTLGIDYDKDSLTLKEAKKLGELGGELTYSGNKVLWLNNTRKDCVYNGEFLQLVFEVSPYAVAQDYSVSISYNAGNIINFALEDVDFEVEQGVVTVESFTAGDLNGDGVVNNKDLVLMSEIFSRNYDAYLFGKEHTVNNKVKNFNIFGKAAMNELKKYDIVALGVTVSRVALDCNDDGVINNHDLLTMMKYLRGEEITIK